MLKGSPRRARAIPLTYTSGLPDTILLTCGLHGGPGRKCMVLGSPTRAAGLPLIYTSGLPDAMLYPEQWIIPGSPRRAAAGINHPVIICLLTVRIPLVASIQELRTSSRVSATQTQLEIFSCIFCWRSALNNPGSICRPCGLSTVSMGCSIMIKLLLIVESVTRATISSPVVSLKVYILLVSKFICFG